MPMKSSTLSALSGLAMTTLALTAQTQNSTAPIVLDRLMVTTAAGHEQKITEAPASISVLGPEQLERRRYANLAEALDDVEGVDIRQGTGKTGGLDISIRGLPSQYTLILIDGRRQNTAGTVTPNGFDDTATSFMPPPSAIRSEEHTSELQSRGHLVCRLLLVQKKQNQAPA